jgi:uncharacterized phage protein (TIGR02218 family)
MLQQSVGRVYAAACDANFGDTRCKMNLAPLTVTGTSHGDDRRTFADSGQAGPDDYWGTGVITWVTGLNAGLRMEIATYTIGGHFGLQLPMPKDVQVGDTYTAVPGCRKRRLEDCNVKWGNVVNFRGFPDVPLNDTILGNASASDN